MATRDRRDAGFSLLEMLIAMTVFVAVLGIALTALSTAKKTAATESGALETQQAARMSIDELALNLQQTGYGIARPSAYDHATWQRMVVYAGAHVLAFNADINFSVGPITSSTTITFPDSTTYVGEGATTTTTGAETYVYTIDANDDGSITQADRSSAATGVINPAAETANPLDYALFRKIYGYDGSTFGGSLVPVTGFLYTNATSSDLYPNGNAPNPLFTYYLTEDLNADGVLDNTECVVVPCPPTATRDPKVYLWGDTDFDGTLSESEKSALRTLRVGAPGWSRNRLVSGGAYPTTTLSAAVVAASVKIKVANAAPFAKGEFLQIGSGGSAEKVVIATINTGVTPQEITLTTGVVNAHAASETVASLEETFLRAVRSVRISFDAIVPVADYDTTTASAGVGRAGHVGTGGSAYRVRSFERKIDLVNMRGGD